VPPYLLGSSLSAILAQRLVKKICPHCKVELPLSDELLALIEGFELTEITKHYKGEGCQHCYNTGYFGRTAVYEYLPVSLGVKTVLFKDASEITIAKVAKLEGVKLLFADAWEKVGQGITTAEDVLAKIPLEAGLVRKLSQTPVGAEELMAEIVLS
jgi:type II secretory ATPase GspE/PulE/Tfp pilus assembly ATPase PilB-like protein